MLSPSQRAIIAATVPLLETGGETLIRHFYRTLFEQHPEVLPYFNTAHQQTGGQQRALAMAVLMYARHIDQLDALGPLVERIVQKHVALQILPEHYPVVGQCLLQSIREVLGSDVASEPVLAAWGAAYGLLADILISSEAALYRTQSVALGGWEGVRRFRVIAKDLESTEIMSIRMVPVDGKPIISHRPGQCIGLVIEIDGTLHRRQYSLSAMADGSSYRISVKRQDGGVVSPYLHDRIAPGDTLGLAPPAGAFVLQDTPRPLVFVTAGVGITPAIAMLEAALPSDREIHFIHCARNSAAQAFDAWLQSQVAGRAGLHYRVCLSAPAAGDRHDAVGPLTPDMLAGWLPVERDVEAYFLGPTRFMALVKRALTKAGVPPAQCHYEHFGPAEELDIADA